MTTTLFSWGYYGWGNHTPDLVEAVDAVEASRGFQPPFFVDIRIRRSVRAAGFSGPAFEKLLGPKRHNWMPSLGNQFIVSGTGPGIQVADPKAAAELLDLALELARHRQRVLFFCGCQRPRCESEIACHRATVAELVVKAARKRGSQVEVVEWPGGEPRRIDLQVSPKDFSAVRKGRLSLPLGKRFDLAELAGLPWASIATLHSGDEELRRLIGPAISQAGGWVLPVLPGPSDPAAGPNEYEREARTLREAWGLEAEK
jgi:hypothetical protein